MCFVALKKKFEIAKYNIRAVKILHVNYKNGKIEITSPVYEKQKWIPKKLYETKDIKIEKIGSDLVVNEAFHANLSTKFISHQKIEDMTRGLLAHGSIRIEAYMLIPKGAKYQANVYTGEIVANKMMLKSVLLNNYRMDAELFVVELENLVKAYKLQKSGRKRNVSTSS